MGSRIPERNGHSRGRRAVAALAAVAAASLLGSAPAQARNEFENGFEDQLGRIAAYQAVHLGTHLLFGLFDPYPHRPVVYPRPHRRHHHDCHCGHGGYREPWVSARGHRGPCDGTVVTESYSVRTYRAGDAGVAERGWRGRRGRWVRVSRRARYGY